MRNIMMKTVEMCIESTELQFVGKNEYLKIKKQVLYIGEAKSYPKMKFKML